MYLLHSSSVYSQTWDINFGERNTWEIPKPNKTDPWSKTEMVVQHLIVMICLLCSQCLNFNVTTQLGLMNTISLLVGH